MVKDLEILFLSGLFPLETENEIIKDSKGNIQNAANNLQWEILMGLEENLGYSVKVLNSLYIGSYPMRYKRLFIPTYPFFTNFEAEGNINVGFLNLMGLKTFSRIKTMKPYVKKWIKNKKNCQKIVIAYAMTPTMTSLLEYSKKIDNNIITCLIVPDLPQHMDLSKNNKKSYIMLKNISMNQMKKQQKYIDSFVFLTEYMKESVDKEKPFTVIEGVATDIFKGIDFKQEQKGLKTVLYTGTLMKKYGIIELLTAFEKLENKDYRLIICGAGEAEKEILNAQKRDNRIDFKGLLPRKEILKLQKSATVLINPRSNTEEYTKYSFPSKIMEYMSSGRPLIAYQLDGMPKEYEHYFFSISENGDSDSFYRTLKETLEKSNEELNEKGYRAKEFVLQNKNKKIQTSKILDMIYSISKENFKR